MLKLKILLFAYCLVFLIPIQLFAQNNDSTTKKASFRKELKSNKIKFTKAQLKARPYFNQGTKFMDKHEFKDAIKQFKKAIKIDSTGNCGSGENGMAYDKLAYSYSILEKDKKALPILNRAIEINKDLSIAYLNRGILYNSNKQYELAIRDFEKYIELESRDGYEMENPALVEAIKKQVEKIKSKLEAE